MFHLLPPCDAYRLSLTALPIADYKPSGPGGALEPVLRTAAGRTDGGAAAAKHGSCGDSSEEPGGDTGVSCSGGPGDTVIWSPVEPRPAGRQRGGEVGACTQHQPQADDCACVCSLFWESKQAWHPLQRPCDAPDPGPHPCLDAPPTQIPPQPQRRTRCFLTPRCHRPWWRPSARVTCCTCPPCGITLSSSAATLHTGTGWSPSTLGAHRTHG